MLALYTLFKEDGVSISELGKRCFIDNSTLTGVIDRLEHQGLLTRNDAPDDRRTYIVSLTEKSQELRSKLHDVSKEIFSTMVEGCTEAEIVTFRKVLLKIFNNL